MLIQLHSQAITTPKIRADIQVSDEPALVMEERFGSTEPTVSGTVCDDLNELLVLGALAYRMTIKPAACQ